MKRKQLISEAERLATFLRQRLEDRDLAENLSGLALLLANDREAKIIFGALVDLAVEEK